MSDIEIHSITFAEDGVAIQYMQHPDDVRVQGRVILTHTIQLHASHPDYREDIEDLERTARRAVKNALEDFHDSEPFVADQATDEEEPKGMGE